MLLVWGYPGPKAVAARRRGLIEYGGCMIDNAHLNCRCQACGHQWESPEPPHVDWDSIKGEAEGPQPLWQRMKAWLLGR